MKILVAAHRLELGGSQTNTIELAAASRDRCGHDVVVFAEPGPASALLDRRGLRLVESPSARMHPSASVMRALDATVRREQPDVVHAWEWPQCLDAFFGPHLRRGVPLVGTNMAMAVLSAIPRTIPLTLGTEELAVGTRRHHRAPVVLLEPPVDTDADDPTAVDPGPFLSTFRLDPDLPRLVLVSRLVDAHKLEGIERSIDAIGCLDRTVTLVVVGEGPMEAKLRDRAAAVNASLGRTAVVLAGGLADPRPAYACADVVLGNAGSALRGLAFGKPTIVLGERGYTAPVTPETAADFAWRGFYGIGDGRPSDLVGQLRCLLDDAEERRRLGEFSRSLVLERYSLTSAADRLDALYRSAVSEPPTRSQTLGEAARLGLYLAARRGLEQVRRFRR